MPNYNFYLGMTQSQPDGRLRLACFPPTNFIKHFLKLCSVISQWFFGQSNCFTVCFVRICVVSSLLCLISGMLITDFHEKWFGEYDALEYVHTYIQW